jgi:hypothetical protein
VGKTPARNTPVSAPRVVVVSRTMATRMFVKPLLRHGAALAHEHAITDTMLQATAACMLIPPTRVRNGTMNEDAAGHSEGTAQRARADRHDEEAKIRVSVHAASLLPALTWPALTWPALTWPALTNL